MATYQLRAGFTSANVGVIFIDSLRSLDLARSFNETNVSGKIRLATADIMAVQVANSQPALTAITEDPTVNEVKFLQPVISLVPYTATGADTLLRRADGIYEDKPLPDDKHPGIHTPSSPAYSNTGTTGVAANRAFYNRFVLPRPRTIISLAFMIIVAAGANDAVDVGLYDAAGNRLVSTGATLGLLNSGGLKNPAITPTALEADTVYYAAWSMGTIGGTVVGVQTRVMNTADNWRMFGTALPDVDVEIQAAAHPLPSTITPAGTGITTTPIIIPRWA